MHSFSEQDLKKKAREREEYGLPNVESDPESCSFWRNLGREKSRIHQIPSSSPHLDSGFGRWRSCDFYGILTLLVKYLQQNVVCVSETKNDQNAPSLSKSQVMVVKLFYTRHFFQRVLITLYQRIPKWNFYKLMILKNCN